MNTDKTKNFGVGIKVDERGKLAELEQAEMVCL
jgi:hypothetical protein